MRQRKISRENQRLADGRYVYYRWDEEAQKEITIYLTAGKDEVSEEILLVLEDMDHEEDLQERYADENRDYATENQKLKFSTDSEETVGDPIENLATFATNPEYLLEHGDSENALVEKVRQAVEQLTPQQIDLFYALFGEMRSMADIAREQGKTRQAVNNQKNKILNRIKKLLDEQK